MRKDICNIPSGKSQFFRHIEGPSCSLYGPVIIGREELGVKAVGKVSVSQIREIAENLAHSYFLEPRAWKSNGKNALRKVGKGVCNEVEGIAGKKLTDKERELCRRIGNAGCKRFLAAKAFGWGAVLCAVNSIRAQNNRISFIGDYDGLVPLVFGTIDLYWGGENILQNEKTPFGRIDKQHIENIVQLYLRRFLSINNLGKGEMWMFFKLAMSMAYDVIRFFPGMNLSKRSEREWVGNAMKKSFSYREIKTRFGSDIAEDARYDAIRFGTLSSKYRDECLSIINGKWIKIPDVSGVRE